MSALARSNNQTWLGKPNKTEPPRSQECQECQGEKRDAERSKFVHIVFLFSRFSWHSWRLGGSVPVLEQIKALRGIAEMIQLHTHSIHDREIQTAKFAILVVPLGKVEDSAGL